MRRLAALLILLALALNACEAHNPNYDPPPAYEPNPVGIHHFDGGASDPYSKDSGGSGGGESSSGGGEAQSGGSQ